MKTLLITTLTLLFTLFSTALMAQTIYVVDNNLNAPAGDNVFTTIQEAHDAAAPGDILHIVGSTTIYSSATITKPLTILGAGFNPNKDVPNTSRVEWLTIGNEFEVISNITIKGLDLSGVDLVHETSELLFENNLFRDSVRLAFGATVDSVTIRNNLFNNRPQGQNAHVNLRNSEANNIIINNNIFTSGGQSINANNSALILNNLFLGSGTASDYAFRSIDNSIISNNIFFGSRPSANQSQMVNGNIFTNNLSFGNSDDSFPIGERNNTGSGNLVGIDPLFINLESTNVNWDFEWDPGVETGSPVIGAGTDGTDLGIFGGGWPFDTLYTGGSPLPYIKVLNAASVIQEGQDLLIDVEAAANQ